MDTDATRHAPPTDLAPLARILAEEGSGPARRPERALIELVGEAYGLNACPWCCKTPSSRLAEVAFKGSFRLRYRAHWGEAGEVVGAPMSDPTWLMLWAAARHAIELSGDGHHVFVESFAPGGAFIELQTGS